MVATLRQFLQPLLLALPALLPLPVLAVVVSAQVTGPDGAMVEDAVLSIEGGDHDFSQPETAVMDQRQRQFAPHVLPVRVNTLVSFPNSDDIRHQVYSFSAPKRFQLALYHGMPSEPVHFDQPGVVVLGCNIHDQMLGYIYVVATPWFAISDATGRLRIADVAPGQYTARLWHPRLAQPIEQPLTVADEEVTLSFALPALLPDPRSAVRSSIYRK
jgi:plastocyanin